MAAIISYHKLGGLRQQNFILSQSWSSGVQHQGASRTMLPPKALWKNPSLSLPASGGFGHSRLCDSFVSVFTGTSFSHKDTCHLKFRTYLKSKMISS